MYKINKITSNPTVDYAAEELKKYLRMMMPRCGEIEIAYAPDAKDGFRLGVMADFSLDTSEAKDTYLDDIDTVGHQKAGVEQTVVSHVMTDTITEESSIQLRPRASSSRKLKRVKKRVFFKLSCICFHLPILDKSRRQFTTKHNFFQ